MATLTYIIVLVSATTLAQSPAPMDGPRPDCSEVLMEFAPVQKPYLDRIQISEPHSNARSLSPSTKGAVKAPQSTRWFVLDAADTTKKGPWSTMLRVYGNPKDAPLLEGTFSQHHNHGVKVKWLNDKLLFIDVPWGRLLATQIILDVETRKQIYADNVHYTPCAVKP